MSVSDYIVAGVICVVGGAALGVYFAKRDFSPKAVYVQELNGDNRLDVIVETESGKIAYLQQKDGTYQGLDQTLNEQREFIQRKLKVLK